MTRPHALSPSPATLIDAFAPPSRLPIHPLARNLALVVLGSLLLILSARLQAPMWPVPMTMQSFVVLFLGAALGPVLGGLSVALYLAQGLSGLPVFALPGAAGPAYFLGPTGGFLLSFVPAAVIAGLFARNGASLARVGFGMILAHALILALGTLWLAYLAQMPNGMTGLGIERAWLRGFEPFILGSLVKAALATACVAAGWSLARRRG